MKENNFIFTTLFVRSKTIFVSYRTVCTSTIVGPCDILDISMLVTLPNHYYSEYHLLRMDWLQGGMGGETS